MMNHTARLGLVGLLFGFGPLLLACRDDGRACNVNADCASGQCRSDGTCAAAATGDDGDSGAVTVHADAGQGGSDAAAQDGASADGGACLPNHDGVVDRSEVVFVSGAHANFRVAQGVTVDTAGQTQPDGSRIWDYSGALAGDHDMKLETEDPTKAWYAKDFSSANFAAKMSDTQSLRGVFQSTNDAILLLGVVSPADGSSKTELTYTAPVPVMQFPLKDGASWTATPTVNGVTSGVPSSAVQSYDTKVDAHGKLVTPLATFDVLRVATTVTGPLIYTRQFTFVAECFGTVAVVTSQNGETTAEFTNAAEIQRIAP